MGYGNGGVYRRGNRWYIHYSKDGVQHRESAQSTVRADAVALLRQRLASPVAAGSPTMEVLLDAVLQDYERNRRRSIDDVRRRVTQLKERWGAVKAKDFTASSITLHIDERLKDDVAPATINRELSIIRRAFRLAVERGQVVTAPIVRLLREDNVRTGFFTDEEFRRLHRELPGWMQNLALMAYWTGCRLGELRSLRWGQVDLDKRLVRLERTKNGQARTIPLPPEVAAALAVGQAIRGPVFPGPDGEPIRDTQIYEPWREACAKAGLEGRLFHDFRRTAVRNMIRAGVPQRMAMAISGHKTQSMLTRYDIVDEADLLGAVAKMADYMRSEEPAQQNAAQETISEVSQDKIQ